VNNQIKAFIFDLGGVLIKTEDPAPRIELASQFQTTREDLERWVFLSQSSIESEQGLITAEDHWHVVMDHYGQDQIDAAKFSEQFFSGDVLDQQLLEFIRKKRKKYLTGLLSNAWKNARKSLSERFNFLDDFDAVVFSSEVGIRKPDPCIYFELLGKLGFQPQESIFTDDSRENVEAARQIGMKAILFTSTQRFIKEASSLD